MQDTLGPMILLYVLYLCSRVLFKIMIMQRANNKLIDAYKTYAVQLG